MFLHCYGAFATELCTYAAPLTEIIININLPCIPIPVHTTFRTVQVTVQTSVASVSITYRSFSSPRSISDRQKTSLISRNFWNFTDSQFFSLPYEGNGPDFFIIFP